VAIIYQIPAVSTAIKKAGLKKGQRPILVSDNGSCNVSSELKNHLATEYILHIHERVIHPQTQAKQKGITLP